MADIEPPIALVSHVYFMAHLLVLECTYYSMEVWYGQP